ncbi:MBL fold metallo-hydrolase [Streptomyces phaeochromogenes]|uniref:MBL fold metallo-hydrolase n=1 Tax=Streptomyces phaeochromogenes TaxID=1923 RepID=UPI0033FC26F9
MQQDTKVTIQSDPPLSTVNATYVTPSTTEQLASGSKLGELFTLNATRPYFLQKLTERTYFFGGGFYTTTFYVGDEGVLLLDPPEGQGANLVAAIAQVTGKPVTAIVYSHYHADHIISTPAVLDASRAAGVKNVRVIASTETEAKMKLLKSGLPAPTEILDWPDGSFEFEGLTVRLNGFTRAAHTDDAAALLLVEEKVAHLPDLVNGDQPPFRSFGSAENYIYYRSNVNELGALDWNHLVGGHGNVGSKEDIRFHNTFLDDLEAAVGEAMASTQFGAVVDDLTKFNNHAALMDLWLKAVTAKATDELRPKYGKFYGFEITAPANAEMVTLSMVSYR